MQLFFENIAIHINEEFVLSNDIWKEIGNIMHSNRKQMSLEFERPPRNIFKHSNGFKATEWSNWIITVCIQFPFLKINFQISKFKLYSICFISITIFYIKLNFIYFQILDALVKVCSSSSYLFTTYHI